MTILAGGRMGDDELRLFLVEDISPLSQGLDSAKKKLNGVTACQWWP